MSKTKNIEYFCCSMKTKNKILVLCTGNSCRSQMAEAYLKHYSNINHLNIEVFSAGTAPHGVNPRVVKVLCEDKINISDQTSNHVNEYLNSGISHVITVCDHAMENCPVFPEKTIMEHHNFKDPSNTKGNPEIIKKAFRQTRDEIKLFCEQYLNKHF